jgi:hypothetical protein
MAKLFNQHGIKYAYILVFILVLLFFIWAMSDYQTSLKNNLLSEARTVAHQLSAMKNYLQQEQDTINTDS